MKSKRFLCLLLVLLMVFSLTPSETRAETTVYFTAVNDQLLPDLSDETMPFWSGGRLYVPSTVITGTDLGLFYSRSRDKSTAVVYRQGSALTFNFAAGTVADQNDRQYSGPAIVRSDVVFLPLDLLTQFFSLDYSYTRVTYGYLVRVKSDTVVLSDAKFIDAAAMSMEQRYNEYMKTHSESNDPGNTPNQNTDGDRDLVCLALRVTDEESANALLDTLASNNATATFLFSEEQLSSLGDLLRRVVISGNAAALRIDASGGSSRTVSAIERANNALWAACNEKARLVALYGASDKTLRAVRAAFPDVLEVLLIVQFIQIALHGSVGCAGQLHRIGKNPVMGLFAAEFPCVVGLRVFEQHVPFPEAECSRRPGQPQQQLIFRLVAAGGLPQHLDVIGKIALIVCGVLVHNGFQRSDQVHIFKLLHGLHLQFFCLFPWLRLLALLLFCGIQLYPDGRLFRLGCA